jgi:hypothetical protein
VVGIGWDSSAKIELTTANAHEPVFVIVHPRAVGENVDVGTFGAEFTIALHHSQRLQAEGDVTQ